jgi:hypothetical protein
LKPYRMPPDRALTSATLVCHPDKMLTVDLGDGDIADAFELAEAVAFSGLSARRFFEHNAYSNRDTFSAVVQRFAASSGGASMRHRRRDGSVLGYWPDEYFKVVKELHIEEKAKYAVDELFASAVLRTMREDEKFDRAIRSFNEANTDRSSSNEVLELVSTVSAFQQLLDVPGGNVRETREKFLKAMEPVPVRAQHSSNAAVEARLSKFANLRDLWMADLCNLRGSVGHGHRVDAYPALWSPMQHLLLAAHIFPSLVRLRLAAEGGIELSKDDKFKLGVFDRLLAASDVFGVKRDKSGLTEGHLWNEVWAEADWSGVGDW